VVEAGADDIWSVAPLVWHGTRAWAEATRLAVDEPSARQLQRLRRHSAELAHRATGAVAGADAVVATFALMCAAETARAENRPDPEAWRRVVELWERHSQPYPAAYARLRFAEALLINRSRSAAASNALRGAEREARRLGARPLLGQIVELAIRARVTLDRASEKSVPQPHGEQHGPLDALTTRELEVLTELASGRSDREIGNRLFISEKTVGVHVSRIFTKIGVHSRVQASAVLHNHPGT
jgi:DNA-binding NarL/FixJ family response regulator